MRTVIKYTISILLFTSPLMLYGQHGVVTTGGHIEEETGSMSFSTGQTDFISITSNDFVLQFGLQQAFMIAPVNVEEIDDLTAGLFRIYPNPTDGQFTLELDNYNPDKKVFTEIYNINGVLMQQKETTAERTINYNLHGYEPGIYIIRVTQGNNTGIKQIVKR